MIQTGHAERLLQIEAYRTKEGGWTKATLSQWGVGWPPPKGWKKKIVETGFPLSAIAKEKTVAPYKNTWQRLLDGEYGRRVTPLSETDASHFYWCTDVKTPEIQEAFPEYDIGEALLENAVCIVCKSKIRLKSRTEAEQRAKDWREAEQRTDSNRRRGMMCKDCYRRDIDEDGADFRAEMQAREKRAQDLRFMPYADYLQTPEWRTTRQYALKRAGFKCQTCSNDGQLHVHHRTYIRRGAERASDLIVLCADCHSLFHENRRLAENGRAA